MGQHMGLIKISPSIWRFIEYAITLPMEKTIEKLDMTTLLQHLIDLRKESKVIATSDLWLECGNQNDVEIYENLYNN